MGDVLLVLVLGTLVSWLSHRYRIPNAAAQVILGILLGGAVFGLVSHDAVLHALGEVGVILLLGVAGLEMGSDRLKAAGRVGVVVAILGVVLSFAGGYAVGWAFGSPTPEAWYLGLALAATSIGISVQVLKQYGLIEHRVGEVIIAAAVIDDVIVLYLLAAAHGIFSDGLNPREIALNVVGAILVLCLIYWLARFVTRRMARRGWLDARSARLTWILVAVFAGAVLTEAMSLSAVVGGFFSGLGVGDGFGRRMREHSTQDFQPVLWVAIPFFFVMIGVQAEWRGLMEPESASLLASLLVVGFAGKALAGVLGVARDSRQSERWLVGFGMVARGEVALVIATLGYAQGHLDHHVFVVLVTVIIVLSVLGPTFMASLARRVKSRDGVS